MRLDEASCQGASVLGVDAIGVSTPLARTQALVLSLVETAAVMHLDFTTHTHAVAAIKREARHPVGIVKRLG